jgi:hypothetical protein
MGVFGSMGQGGEFALQVLDENENPVEGLVVDIFMDGDRYLFGVGKHVTDSEGEVRVDIPQKAGRTVRFEIKTKVPGKKFVPSSSFETFPGTSGTFRRVYLVPEGPEIPTAPKVPPAPTPVGPPPLEPVPKTEPKKALPAGTEEAIAVTAAIGGIALILFLLK